MGKLKFETFLHAIESSTCNDAIKHIVNKLDHHWRADEVDCTEKDWPLISTVVAAKKDTGNDDDIKNVWRITFIDGKHCAMINPEHVTFTEALEFAVHRFDSNRVLTVD